MSFVSRLVVYGLLLIIVLVSTGCGGLNLGSVWRTEPVTIDGIPLEWKGATTWVENPNVTIGVKNDDEYLYLCLASPVREIAAQIAMRGFIVWLDPEGKKGKTFGVRCPVGPAMGTGKPKELSEVTRDRDKFMDMIVERLKGAGSVLEILGPDEDSSVRLTAGEAPGLDVAVGYYEGRVVYELKVPFHRDDEHPFAIGGNGKGRIGVGFVTPEIKRDEMMSHADGERPAGGMMGGAPWGDAPAGDEMGGGPPPGRGPGTIQQAVDIWGKITLATAAMPQGDDSKSED
jgi:hypothetical protein